MKKIKIFSLFVCLAMLVIACHNDDDERGVQMRTVLVYIAGDNSLRSFATEDLAEMTEGMQSVDDNSYNLLVYIDTGPSPKLIRLKKDKKKNVVQEAIATYEGRNSVDVSKMKEVINTAFSEYPAQSYGLVLWSHGEGWLAKSQNKTRWWGQDGGSNYMDISELKDVLRNAPHLSFLLFDACFMQSVEVVYELKEHADYIIGSPTEIPAPGAPYQKVVPSRFPPPWYRSVMAYICYIVLALFGMWGVYRWDDMRVKRKKQQAIVEKDKELFEMEKEYEEEKARNEKQIMQLEKEKLEHDLQHKSQEMANLMINFVRKNEMLTEIKSEIAKVSAMLKGEGSRESKQQLILINSKIDSNIQSDEVLKRIEDQFDLIHNNFMKRLHAKHPDLSNNERMMCAYLKMNLSTKEIAPLLNISVRGVETIRYRLRKKFGLEREDSLTDYLSNYL